ncbi:hypothetical protein Gohar_003000 [Gossypium harknessii]|uniref:WRKY domain-containing protein n=1 Tax=Gossypium harknessii TaxID=34285 RepID=A0A7J9HQB2_9ROSI|nr:hypothetical protein [Gossypium harknessii]
MWDHEFRNFHCPTDHTCSRVSLSAADPCSYMRSNFTDSLQSPIGYGRSLEKALAFSHSSSSQPPFSSVGATPNSCISYSSTQDGSDKSNKDCQLKELEDGSESSKKGNKLANKKGEKKHKETRFAFMTKSEVDLLEDGYKWRKYGQKAVKNSPYPRSYYRCTTQKCRVKKRVERSFQDPSMVITTYEGQHKHLLPTTVKRPMLFPSFMLRPSPPPPRRRHELFTRMPGDMNNYQVAASADSLMFAENFSPFLQVPDNGLLQDMVPSAFLKHEPYEQ